MSVRGLSTLQVVLSVIVRAWMVNKDLEKVIAFVRAAKALGGDRAAEAVSTQVDSENSGVGEERVSVQGQDEEVKLEN
ncbi:hypothetical protein ACEPAG_9696 [Sanghuangporus baumii]